jgi:hypothetical protein
VSEPERPPASAGRARHGGAQGRIPDFFIVGHEKCGTTALYSILRQHPQIFMPDVKEPRFLAGDPQARRGAGAQGPGGLPRTLEEYLALFAPAAPAQLAGEASPQYLRSPAAATRIAELQPRARIIALLREPVSFLRTYHLNNVRGRVESEHSLRRALALEAERRERLEASSLKRNRLMYAELVRYVEQLERFERVLGCEQMHVIVYEDFRADNAAAVRGVLRFLGVEEDFAFERYEVRRERKAVRMQRTHRAALALQRARRRPERAGTLMRGLGALAPRAARLEGLARRLVFSVAPPLDEDLELELRRRFRPEVAALSEHLGRDLLARWGYEEAP